jgi:hypothetical protein
MEGNRRRDRKGGMTEFVRPAHERARPVAADRPVARRAVDELQSAAGNRAVTGLLVQREADTKRADANAERVDADAESLFGQIHDLVAGQARAWRSSATRGREVPPRPVLVYALESLGSELTSVIGEVADSAPMRATYVDMVRRELGDEAAVTYGTTKFGGIRAAVLQSFMGARSLSLQIVWEIAETVLLDKPEGALDTYLAGVRLHLDVNRQLWLKLFRQDPWRAAVDDIGLRSAGLTLDALHRTLRAEPAGLQRVFTTGYLRLLDEFAVSDRLPDYMRDGSPDYATRFMAEGRDENPNSRRPGALTVRPAGALTVGEWANPQLGFNAFSGSSSGVDTKALSQLNGRAVKDLPLTLDFQFLAADPYTRPILGRGAAEIRFSRDPLGTVRLDNDLDEAALEWLGSYHSGISRELTDAERARHAPLGAKKLYAAIAGKPIAALHSTD